MQLVKLTRDTLNQLMPDVPRSEADFISAVAFSQGSVSRCVMVDGKPVLAGGIIAMGWKRGEVWMKTTPFLKQHMVSCYREIKEALAEMVHEGGFDRVQAVCEHGTSPSIIVHLGFEYEGTLRRYSPHGNACALYARMFGGAI